MLEVTEFQEPKENPDQQDYPDFQENEVFKVSQEHLEDKDPREQ